MKFYQKTVSIRTAKMTRLHLFIHRKINSVKRKTKDWIIDWLHSFTPDISDKVYFT